MAWKTTTTTLLYTLPSLGKPTSGEAARIMTITEQLTIAWNTIERYEVLTTIPILPAIIDIHPRKVTPIAKTYTSIRSECATSSSRMNIPSLTTTMTRMSRIIMAECTILCTRL